LFWSWSALEYEREGTMSKLPSYLLNLAGEYRVCSELNKRGVLGTMTYGNRKGADVYAMNDRDRRVLKIEVKTSQQKNFVTSITQKGMGVESSNVGTPDFWVLVQILREVDPDGFHERFFVLTHKEICGVQERRNMLYGERYSERHGRQPDFSKGVDNVTVDDVEPFEDKWDKIIDAIGGPEVSEK
jgi:hypothetical protein